MSDTIFCLDFHDHRIKWRIRLQYDFDSPVSEEYQNQLDTIKVYSCTLEFYNHCNSCDTKKWISVTGMNCIIAIEPIKMFIEEGLAGDIQESAIKAYNKCKEAKLF